MMVQQKTAIKILLVLLSLVMIFHFLVLFGVIPYTIVWAGKLNSVEEMQIFETVSILINFVLIIVLVIKLNNIKNHVNNKLVNSILWGFVALFVLNTVGNLFSKNKIELVFGTVLTFTFSYLCWRAARRT